MEKEFNLLQLKKEEIEKLYTQYKNFEKLPKYTNALIVYLSLVNKNALILDKNLYSNYIDDYIYYLVKDKNEMSLKVDSEHNHLAYKIDLYKLKVLDLLSNPVFNLNRINEKNEIVKPEWFEEYSLILIKNLELFNKESQTYRYLYEMINEKSIHNFKLKHIYFLIVTDKETIDYLEKKIGVYSQIIK